MIQAVTDYIFNALVTILDSNGDPLPVHPPGVFREGGETIYPCIAMSVVPEPKDELDRPHHKIFLPSDEQRTLLIPEQFGHGFHAEITAGKQEPYQIVSGHDLIVFRVGTPGSWGPEDVIVLPPGTRAAWEIARACNFYARSIKVDYWDGALCLRTAKPGLDIEILEDAASAYDVLGLTPGVTSHLTRTGPVSYTVRPHPMPVILTYQVDLLATDKAQRDALLPMVMNLYPEEHWPTINGQNPHFRRSDHKNFDELTIPKWWSAFWCEVDCVWLDRKDAYQVGSIIEPTVEFQGLE